MFIEDDLYSEIVKSIPILCVDAILKKDNKYLLIKRGENPLSNEWWVPGGRVNIGENIENAIKRKIKNELSIDIASCKMIGIYEDFFDMSSFGEHLYHTISFVYEINLDSLDISLDNTSTEWALMDDLPKRLLDKMRVVNG